MSVVVHVVAISREKLFALQVKVGRKNGADVRIDPDVDDDYDYEV